MFYKVVLAALVLCGSTAPLGAQASAGGQPLSFDVFSVKPNKSDQPPVSNFPLGPGDVYVTNGEHFIASNFPLVTYIFFAYKVPGNESQSILAQLPSWATADKFDIEARTDGDPAKDAKNPMRQMMRSLLADRFKLKTHYETRQVPVFGVSPVKAGKLGPQVQPHPADAECTTIIAPADSAAAGANAANFSGRLSGAVRWLAAHAPSAPGRLRAGARNVRMAFVASMLTGIGALERPVLDQTGLAGTYDFVIEWVPDLANPSRVQIGPDFQPDADGPTFDQALQEQLGVKLTSEIGPSEFLIIDRVGHPSENWELPFRGPLRGSPFAACLTTRQIAAPLNRVLRRGVA